MKIKFSRITTGFAIAGLTFGMLSVLESIIYSLASDRGKEFIGNHFDALLYLCPSSILLISFDRVTTASEIAPVFLEIIVANLILYGLVGLVVSQLYRLIKRWTQPSAIHD